MDIPQLPRARVISGTDRVVSGGNPVYALTDPGLAHDRVRALVLELEVDRCLNTFGIAPCTATGVECYNTFATCKDKPNYRRGSQTYRFCLRGQPAPAGEGWRPYILSASIAPTEIQPTRGLAIRSQTRITLADEPDGDTEGDPYIANRATPAAGTFWTRWQARHRNAIGRFARIRRGWLGDRYAPQFFVDELYVIDAVRGPDAQGNVSVVLSDVIRLLDRAMVPAATDGKLQADFKRTVFSGTLTGATTTTAVLPAGASPDPAAYSNAELVIVGNSGSGQRRVVRAYDPATLTVTVDAWSVVPDASSTFELQPLAFAVGSGKGSQYGSSGWVRIGEEIVRFTSRSDDTLYLQSGTGRGQFGTAAADHNSGDGVQLCRVWSDAPASSVVRELIIAAGIGPGYIDAVELTGEDDTWLRESARITACLSEPEKASDLLRELAQDLNLMLWWDPVAQRVRARCNVPQIDANVTTLDDDDFVMGTVRVERNDGERITQAAQYYAPVSATANRREAKNYLRAELRIDTDAESANEYGDQRPAVALSRWLTAANGVHVQALVARRLNYLRDAPHTIEFEVDPRADVDLGTLKDLATRRLTAADGQPATVRARIVKIEDRGATRAIEAVTTTFGGKRYAFIAPAGQANYGTATAAEKRYAYICPASGKFSNGDDAYRII